MKESFCFGGDYNPEQWISHKDTFEDDIRCFHRLGVNTVTLNVFSWAFLEPEEGKYDFSFLSSVIDRMGKEGISVILATPSGAKPSWLAAKYPEVLRVTDDRRRMLFGERHNHCYTSPVYMEKTRLIDEHLSEVFGHNDTVIAWHISNEYGGECHCPLCQEAFRNWLRQRYGSIEELNKRWNNAFWSHIYNSFDDIESPSPIGENKNPSLILDWKRFVTYQTVDFMNAEIKAVRKFSDLPVTTNMMYDYTGLDYSKFADNLDFISWDNYPAWGTGFGGDNVLVAADNALEHDYFRALKDKPFFLMESCPSATNWQPYSHLKRPGVLEAASLEAVAHGSDSVLFFQMRNSYAGYEKFHGALIDNSGRETRVMKEAGELSRKLMLLRLVRGTEIKAEVALINDRESRWAMEGSAGPRNAGLHYRDNLRRIYLGLRSAGVDVDVIDSSHSFDAYKLIVVPMLYMFKDGVADRLRKFTADGGTIVVTHWSGVADECDAVYPGLSPHSLTDVLGLYREELDALADGVCNRAVPVAGNELGFRSGYSCSVLAEIAELTSAEPMMVYGDDFYKGRPAVAVNRYENGRAYYIASMFEEDFYCDFFNSIIPACGIEPIVQGLPRGVIASRRGKYIFIQNFSSDAIRLSDSLSDKRKILIGSSDTLPAYGTIVFAE